MAFWITSRMKAIKRDQINDNDKLTVIKLFGSNYARDLMYTSTEVLSYGTYILNMYKVG